MEKSDSAKHDYILACNLTNSHAKTMTQLCHFFEGKGEIVTYTIIRTAVTDYEGEQLDFPSHKVPYVMAIIKLDEGPMLTAEVVDSLIEDVQIGKNAEMVFRKIIEKGKKGAIHYGYKFRLVWDYW